MLLQCLHIYIVSSIPTIFDHLTQFEIDQDMPKENLISEIYARKDKNTVLHLRVTVKF